MGAKKVIFLTWPTSYAMRFAWEYWLRLRDSDDVMIVDYTNVLNQFLLDFQLKTGSKRFFFSKMMHSINALTFRAPSFWIKVIMDSRKARTRLRMSPDFFLESPVFRKFIKEVSDALLFTNAAFPKESSESLKIGLEKLCRDVIMELPEEVFAADEWIIFNGRFPIDGVLRLFRKMTSAKLVVLEGGSKPNSHISARDLWSASEGRERMASLWHETPVATKEEIASRQFERFTKGSTDLQDYWAGHQVSSFKAIDDRQVVTFFASNEDEMLSDALVEDPYSMNSQKEAIRWIVEHAGYLNYRVVVKEHPFPPNSHYQSDKVNLIGSLSSNNQLVFLDGKSQVSSSSLIALSKLCITFGSSVGVQIVAAQKPLLVLGPNVLFRTEIVEFMWSNKDTFFQEPKKFIFSPLELHQFLFYCAEAGTNNLIRPPLF